MSKVLILIANTQQSSRLRLDEEVRDISDGLRLARDREQFEIVQRWAVRPRDLHRAMLDEMPQIVHFAGDESSELSLSDRPCAQGLCFENEQGKVQSVTAAALTSLFQLFAQHASIHCVILSRCYSQVQAKAIAQSIPYVIGLQNAVDNKAATEFSVGFYDALGSGKPVEFAFESGKVAMALSSTGPITTPVLLKNHCQLEPTKQKISKSQPVTSKTVKTATTGTAGFNPSEDYQHDVYITYSDCDPDAEWVWKKLIPRLERANIRVAVSGELAAPGVAQIVNIERGIQQSKRTLIVLSNAYLKNAIADFENVLSQTMGIQEGLYRLLPVQFEPIDSDLVPPRLSMLSTLDFSRPTRYEHSFSRLISALQSPTPLRIGGKQSGH